jgi:hypothetical protein
LEPSETHVLQCASLSKFSISFHSAMFLMPLKRYAETDVLNREGGCYNKTGRITLFSVQSQVSDELFEDSVKA